MSWVRRVAAAATCLVWVAAGTVWVAVLTPGSGAPAGTPPPAVLTPGSGALVAAMPVALTSPVATTARAGEQASAPPAPARPAAVPPAPPALTAPVPAPAPCEAARARSRAPLASGWAEVCVGLAGSDDLANAHGATRTIHYAAARITAVAGSDAWDYLVAHERGHAEAAGTAAFADEAAADRFAARHGANLRWSVYRPARA